MILKGAPHPAAARRLVDHLASRATEAQLARIESAQMPLRPGIAPHSERFDLARIRTMEVDWAAVARSAPESTKYLQDTFLK